jgi:hypothetical protein
MRSMVEGRLCVPHRLRDAKSSLMRPEGRVAAGGRSALRAYGPTILPLPPREGSETWVCTAGPSRSREGGFLRPTAALLEGVLSALPLRYLRAGAKITKSASAHPRKSTAHW